MSRIIHGTNHGDYLYADPSLDTWMDGRRGDDYLIGQNGNDQLYGNEGNDNLYGYGGNDNIYGGIGDDNLVGGEGTNIMHGNRGDDNLWSGSASSQEADSVNILYGDRGNDTLGTANGGYTRMEGAYGDDQFYIYAETVPNQAIDVILGRGHDTVRFNSDDRVEFSQCHVKDFQPGEDKLDLAVLVNQIGYEARLGTGELFRQLDTDGNGSLDGNDPGNDFAHAFKLGGAEHGIGMMIGGDALVVQLPPGVEALAASDFMLG
jgi:Ca2+-binding RTX toxin-like protein